MRGADHVRAMISDLLLQVGQWRRGKWCRRVDAVCDVLLAGI